MELDAGRGEVLYRPRQARGSGPRPAVESFAAADFLALLLQHVPEPRLHQVRYYGHYSNVARARRAAAQDADASGSGGTAPPAQHEVDPLTCRQCGGQMRILAFIQEPGAIRKILAHLQRQGSHPSRAPPEAAAARARAAF